MQYPIIASDVFNGLVSGSVAERRAQIEQQASVLRAERQLQMQAVRSILSSAHERICLWEKLHRLHLPRDANHKLLPVIARETELSLHDVQQEQARRNTKKSIPAST